MKKQLKKTVSLGLAAVMALGLTACGGGSSSSDSTTAAAGSGETKTEAAADSGNSGDVKVIKLFHRFPDDPCNSFIESKLAEYESLHPDIKFEVTSAQNQPYKEKIKVVVGSDECPDIFFSFCGEFSERFIREGLLLDLTPYMEADPDWKASLYGNSCSRWIPGIYKHCGCHRNFPEHRASASVYQLWCKFSGKSLYRHRRSLKRRTAAK